MRKLLRRRRLRCNLNEKRSKRDGCRNFLILPVFRCVAASWLGYLTPATDPGAASEAIGGGSFADSVAAQFAAHAASYCAEAAFIASAVSTSSAINAAATSVKSAAHALDAGDAGSVLAGRFRGRDTC